MEAMWDCASQVWVPGRLVGHVCRGVRISFLRHNSATIQFQVLMSMQMDAEFKKEQNDTFFVWVGALEGVFGGWVVPQRGLPQKVDMPSKTIYKAS